jgi:hypothetical protein
MIQTYRNEEKYVWQFAGSRSSVGKVPSSWEITLRRWVFGCRRFETTYWSNLQQSSSASSSFSTLVKVKIPVTDPKVQRGSRGIALLFLDLGDRTGWVVSTTPRPLYPRERPSTHCTGGWVGPRAGLDRCEKSRPHRDSIPGASSP